MRPHVIPGVPREVGASVPDSIRLSLCCDGDRAIYRQMTFTSRQAVLEMLELCSEALPLFDPSVPIPGVTPEERAAALQPTDAELERVSMDAWRESEPSRRPADLCAPCLEPETAVSTGDALAKALNTDGGAR